MFAYSLAGLQIEGDASGVTEVEENEITARSAVYQVLGRLFTVPDDDHYEKARDGQWTKEITEAAALLAFSWDIGEPEVADDLSKSTYVGEFDRLFRVDTGNGSRLRGGTYADDPAQVAVELERAYGYYGLAARGDGIAPDQLTVELDFMQFLTFKEAAASSPRLAKSFRRAQQDFFDRQLGSWVPTLAATVRGEGPLQFFGWVVDLLESFVAADREWAAG
jgi:DMSO reductase family type II enzyme chaperone